MTRDNTAIDNSSDIVRRTMSILINDSMPKAEQIVYLEQSLTALASFTTGDAARADQLRELCTQLQRTIDAIEQSLSAASRRFAQVSVRGRTEFARSTSET
jgi:hypothetical protein